MEIKYSHLLCTAGIVPLVHDHHKVTMLHRLEITPYRLQAHHLQKNTKYRLRAPHHSQIRNCAAYCASAGMRGERGTV